jgi:TonB family protein
MCCKSLWKRIVPLVLALVLGLFATAFLQKEYSASRTTYSENGIGSSGHSGGSFAERTCFACKEDNFDSRNNDKPLITSQMRIISKPRPNYTDKARQNQIQGKIQLRVTFLATGEIGSVSPLSSLPDGLTEQAIIAAQNIKFEPATEDGRLMTVTKLIEYNFTIY